jgi:hypothetical protein
VDGVDGTASHGAYLPSIVPVDISNEGKPHVDGFYGALPPIAVAVLDTDQPPERELVSFHIRDGRYHAPGVRS